MLVTPAMGIFPRWKRERIAISGSTKSLSGLIGAGGGGGVILYR